ncbi:MAG: hypothetical protein V1885_00435 [Candidatus Brennerbacteria bacterium]
MKAFLASRPLVTLTAISAVFLVIAGLMFVLHWSDFSPRVVLHFAPLEGADLFGTRADVLTLWILGAAVAVVNVFLAHIFYDRSRELSLLFGGVNVFLMLILLIAIGTIVSVN